MIESPASGRERTPGAVLVVVAVLVAGALLFVGLGTARVASAGLFGALTLPLVLLGADLLIGTALLTRWYPIRPVAQALAAFGILVHALVALHSGPLWTRGCSAVLVLAHIAALLLMFRLTAAEDELDDELDDELAEGPDQVAPAPEPMELVEIPVTEVTDVQRVRDEERTT